MLEDALVLLTLGSLYFRVVSDMYLYLFKFKLISLRYLFNPKMLTLTALHFLKLLFLDLG